MATDCKNSLKFIYKQCTSIFECTFDRETKLFQKSQPSAVSSQLTKAGLGDFMEKDFFFPEPALLVFQSVSSFEMVAFSF